MARGSADEENKAIAETVLGPRPANAKSLQRRRHASASLAFSAAVHYIAKIAIGRVAAVAIPLTILHKGTSSSARAIGAAPLGSRLLRLIRP
jgi:hypothetical protein